MQRLAFVLLFAAGAAACSDEAVEPPNPDAGPALPDARVIDRFDGGGELPDVPAPTVTAVSPAAGPETGGTRVTVRGTSFVEPAEVFFGSTPATSVVVLDEVSVAATTPAGAIGPVDVKVVTAGGEGLLAGGFQYHKDLRVTAIQPARIPEEGGVLLQIDGRAFDASTVILIGRRPLAGARLLSSERIEGYAPAMPPGRPEVYAFTRDAEARRSDLLVVFATPEIEAIAPGYGPLGGSAQAIAGSGLQGTEQILVGTATAPSYQIRGPSRVELRTPVLGAEGAYDVRVWSRDAEATLPGGFIAIDPLQPGRALIGVVPNRASTAGGDVVAVVGRGLLPNAAVTIGGVAAPATSSDFPRALLVSVPAGLAVGMHDVVVTMGALVLTLPSALRIYEDIKVESITPSSGPTSGGTTVTISGTGFVPGVEVRIGAPLLADVVVVSGNEITGRVVAGAGGPQDVVVKSADDRGVLAAGFTFDEAFEVIRLDPVEGSIAGNTRVSVLGRGLTGPSTVAFGGTVGLSATVESGSVLTVRTQPARSGTVDVVVTTPRGEVTLPRAFSFYDPRLVTGGVWGGPIQGSVNVGVIDINSGQGIPGMVVQVGYDADLRHAGVTDENGLVTISAPELQGPQTVTAGQNEIEFVTYAEVNARNLTMFASPYPQSQPPDAPRQPCPSGGEAPVVRGRVFKFKSSLDPVTRPGWLPVARITYSDANVFSPNPALPAEQVDYVFGDGQTYEIVVMRGGTVAVYATLGDFNQDTQEFIPRRMGIVRNVPAAIGETIEDVNISLDLELDREIDARLDNPPAQIPGPSINAVFPFLNLGSDGVIAFQAFLIPDDFTIPLTGLPNLSGASFFYLAGSFTLTPDGALGSPYSLMIAQSDDDPTDGVDLGPFLRMPENVAPKAGQVAPGGLFSWDQPGIRPDLTSVFVVDVTAVSSCCCVDANANGACDTGEPEQCGGAPVQFVRWSVYGPGGQESYVMPPMPPGLVAFDAPRVYPWVTQQAIAPRFNYSEWVYNQFSPFYWKSWTVSAEQFLAKEQTD
ncbi:MAG: IPT/TIG domain-containing protein [Deltaproteobacteria bacterium]|nr:IPT/TIG domain-containing protein [Deltaproteobacteria bacterium]